MLYLRLEVQTATNYRDADANTCFFSYPLPPPSTVYGCLLSMVGEMNPYAHSGVKLGVGVEHPQPQQTKVIGKNRRWKVSDFESGMNSKPDYVYLVHNPLVWVAIDSEFENREDSLEKRVQQASATHSSRRFGPWTLGDSENLIDWFEPLDSFPDSVWWLARNDFGSLRLPTWISQKGISNHYTSFCRYQFSQTFDQNCMTLIEPKLSIKR